MLFVSEEFAIFLKIEDVTVGVDTLFVHSVKADKVISNLVGRVGEHKHDLFCASGNTAETDCEAISAENGEDHANSSFRELCTNVGSNVVNGSIITLRTGNNSLGHGDDIAISDLKTRLPGRLENRIYNDFCQIITASDDGRAHTS